MVSKLLGSQWSLVDTVASVEVFKVLCSKHTFGQLMFKLTE